MCSPVISASSTSSMVLTVVTIITLILSDTFVGHIEAERRHPHPRSQPSPGRSSLVNEVEPLGAEQSQLSSYETHLDTTETQTTGKQSIMACGGDGGGGSGHPFSEFDSQFILHDYRTCDESARRRRSTEKRPTKSDRDSQIQTIYFGGFFPWLAEEQTLGQSLLDGGGSSSDDRGSNWIRKERRRDKKNQHLVQMTDDALKAARNQSTINYNQERQTSLQMPAQSSSMHYPNSETRHQLGKFILPAVRLALDHINTNRSILSAYKLEVIARDTQCNATISLKQFFDMVYEEPKKMLLYGDACRVSTDPIAKASYFFDLIQISYADTDPIYTIENYPNFFRVVPSENALSLARIPFIRHFNWTRVGTIYQNLPRYSLPHSKLLTDLERFRIVIKQSVSLPGSVDGLQDRDLGDELRKLKEKDVRIILGNFDEEWALLLFCEAYREKMIGRKYQWLLTGFSEAKLWHFYESKGSSCSKQELVIAMDGYIITDITPVTRSQRRTISGLMAHEYLNEYQRRAREMSISIEENKFYGYVYDGIWAIALALNRVDTLLRYYSQLASRGLVKLRPEFDEISSLIDFKYRKPIWVRLIRDALNATRFEGVTGTVSFQKNERPGLITFSQFQAFRDMTEVIIGSYDALKDQLDLNVGFPIIWRGSSPPIDYTIQRVMPFRINRTLFVIISILALLGIVLACVFLFVNIKFRNQRYIKMSSPYLNNLIIIGCILTFTSVIILGLDSGLTSEYNFPYICNARAWVLMAGFTLAFGSMFSKTFRVHSIFTNIKLHKKVIKDYKLFMVVFILLTFDVCILIVWQYFDPFYRETNNGTSLQDPDNEDVIIVPEMEHCQSKRMTIFLSVIYVYKGLLMAFGCFLAWETRHVSIPALNDSKYIGLSVYNVVIMCVIGASLSFILRDQQDASFVIISIFIIFCSTTTLCLVFVPKLIELKQNPRASDHRVRATLKTFKKNYHGEALAHGCRDIHGNIIGRGYGMNLNDRIKLLVDENGKQRSVLKEKTYELEALTSKYRRIQSMLQSGQFLQAVNTSSSAATGAPTSTPASAAAAHHHQQLTPRQDPPAPGLVQSSSCALFPASMSALNAGATTCLDEPAIGGAGGGLLTGRSPIRDRVSFSAAIGGMTIEQFSACMPTAGKSNGKQLNDTSLRRSSPMMSSIAQITNTTSSTINNATDTTGDFSSSKLAATISSIGTTSNSGNLQQQQQQRRQSNLEDELDLGERVQAISRELAASRRNQRNQHREQQATGSGSGILPEASKQRLFRSQDDLSLFTVFSHPRGGGHLQNSRGAVDEDGDQAEDKLGQWLAGPFCTVLLRQTSWDMKPRLSSNQRGASCGANQQQAGRPRQHARHRASLQSTRARFRQHQSGHHQTDNLMLAGAAAKGANGGACERRMPPRTLSMIEYLGLNDFDMIARRHDKILRYRRRMMMMSCCASSSCCLSASNNRQHIARYNIGSHQPMIMSDGNLTNTANPNSSSCDELPLNYSDGLMQTTSLISCSTCCSLASQIYASNSELDYSHYHTSEHQHHKQDRRASCRNNTNFGHSSISGSSTSSSSMSTTNGLDLARSLSSASSSSTSRSSSIIVGAAAGQMRRHERGNRCGGNHLDQTNSSSQSSSLADISKGRRAINCPIHQQSRADTSQKSKDGQSAHDRNLSTGQDAPTSSGRHQQMQQQNTSRKLSGNGAQLEIGQGSFASPELKSLCTSGLLYGPPVAREDANQASASVAPEPGARPHSAIGQLESSGPIDGGLCDHLMTGQPDISIKCDILEDL